MLLSDQDSYFKKTENLHDYVTQDFTAFLNSYFKFITVNVPSFLSKDNTFRLSFSLLFVFAFFIMMVYINGVIINTLSDQWMDGSNAQHLGMKYYWAPEDARKANSDISRFDDTDNYIKVQMFYQVFGDVPLDTAIHKSDIYSFYYHAKHLLLSNDVWRNYINSTQSLINYTQVFALSFFTLLILVFINYWINSLRHHKYHVKLLVAAIIISFTVIFGLIYPISWIMLIFMLIGPILFAIYNLFFGKYFFPSFTSLMLIVAGMVGYLFCSMAWVNNEKEVVAKTYGVYRSFHPDLKTKTLSNIFETNEEVNFEGKKGN